MPAMPPPTITTSAELSAIVRRSCRLLQPVRHPHRVVHPRRGGEMLLGLLLLARPPGELAEAEVTVGDDGAHTEGIGEREGFTVVPLGRLDGPGIAMGGDRAQKVETPRLVAALTALTGESEGSPRQCERFLGPLGEHVRFPQLDEDERLVGS